MLAASAWHIPKFQTLRQKAGVEHKPHCLCKQSRHRSHSYQVRVGTFLKSTFPDTSQGPLPGYHLGPVMLTLSCTNTISKISIIMIMTLIKVQWGFLYLFLLIQSKHNPDSFLFFKTLVFTPVRLICQLYLKIYLLFLPLFFCSCFLGMSSSLYLLKSQSYLCPNSSTVLP